MGLFGPSKKEVWKQLSEEINADYIEGSFLKGSRVEYKHRNWLIYLDTYTVSSGKSSVTYTRMRAPFINTKDFHFKIYRRGFFSDIRKAFGMQDIEIGYDLFDNEFIIKGNDELLVKKLFLNNDIRSLIEKQPKIILEVKDGEGIFGSRFKENEDELYFKVVGVIKNVDTLKNLFNLFSKVLDQFELDGITINQTPEVKLF